MANKSEVFREIRKYVYGVAIAFVPVAVYYGWMEPEAIPIVAALLLAIFNINPKEEVEIVIESDYDFIENGAISSDDNRDGSI